MKINFSQKGYIITEATEEMLKSKGPVYATVICRHEL